MVGLDLDRARLHFAGIGGSGMSALAQFLTMRGATVSGSDRDFDRGARQAIQRHLERLSIRIVPQDGTGVAGADAVIASTAVEARIADMTAAREAGVPLIHRSELLAQIVGAHRTIAVAGSSGKSTVVAMIFEIFRAAGIDPSLITGGNVLALVSDGYLGNAWAGRSPWLVIEADESDGSLVRYDAELGALLNLHRDHKEPAELLDMFARFRERTRGAFVVGEDESLAAFHAGASHVFGTGPSATARAAGIAPSERRSSFTVEVGGQSADCELPVPGRHNVLNGLAAITVCTVAGVPLAVAASALSRFRGVGRRFQTVGVAGGVEVIDDFAHNPQKIEATLATARGRGAGRVLAIFQPHGFGPTRFMRFELAPAFRLGLRPQDRLWLLPIYDAGGTATRDLRSEDLAGDIAALGGVAEVIHDRAALAAAVTTEARAGDLVVVMGARDPSLTDLCAAILGAMPGDKPQGRRAMPPTV